MSTELATSFAKEWIDAWNAHDLERILSHYATEIVFLSPIAAARVGNGRMVGIEALANYWRHALADMPDLRFELKEALIGHESLTILYRNHRNTLVAETVEFNAGNQVVRSSACYA